MTDEETKRIYKELMREKAARDRIRRIPHIFLMPWTSRTRIGRILIITGILFIIASFIIGILGY